MHPANILLLLAGGAAAQSVTVIDFLSGWDNSTLTLKGSDSKGTTYEAGCTASASGTVSSTTAESDSATTTETATDAPSSSAENINLTPITALPTATGNARLRHRQFSDPGKCEPYTLIQGASTWEFHLTDSGALTMDANCHWKGDLTAAKVTCTETLDGAIASEKGTSTTTFSSGELSSEGILNTLPVAQPSGSPATSTGASSGSAAPSNSTLSVTPTPTSSASASASAKSTGLAAQRPLPTGAMTFVGGAIGILAAALAL